MTGAQIIQLGLVVLWLEAMTTPVIKRGVYNAAHREDRLAKQRAYMAAYRASHPEIAAERKRRARQRAAEATNQW